MNGQGQPKPELEDGDDHQPDDAGNISECQGVYPTIGLSGMNLESLDRGNDTDLIVTATRARSAQIVQVKVLYHAVPSSLQHGT